MRPIIIKDKYICKSSIELFKDFSLEDNYLIKEKDDGFKVEGKIVLKGTIFYGDEEEKIQKDIDIDILIPYDKLDSKEMIKILLDKADYSINDNVINFKIKLKVVGDELTKENFMFERKMEFPPKDDDVSLIDNELIKSMEDILKNDQVEMVSTLEEDNKEEVDILDVRLEEEIQTLPLINEEKNEDKEEEKESKKEELLKSEYVTTFFFYRVKENENLDEILNRYHMSIDEFKLLNNKIDVKENDLINIKIK